MVLRCAHGFHAFFPAGRAGCRFFECDLSFGTEHGISEGNGHFRADVLAPTLSRSGRPGICETETTQDVSEVELAVGLSWTMMCIAV